MNRSIAHFACCVAAFAPALTLSGCGGGGGGSAGPGVSIVTPTPTPTPSPSPTPSPAAVTTFGALGQTASQSFAVLGYAYRGADAGFGYRPDPASFDPGFQVGLRYAAPTSLFLALAGDGEGVLSPNGASGTSPTLGVTQLGYTVLGGNASLFVAYNRAVTATLQSSAHGSWIKFLNDGSPYPYRLVEFVYGVPTSPAALPQSGIASYASRENAFVLKADFSAKGLSGSITPVDGGPAYVLSGVSFTGDGSAFAGQLDAGNGVMKGTIEGRFTGPSGAELIAKAVAPRSDGTTVAVVWAAEKT